MLNLAIVLMENAQRFPDRTAVIHDDRKITYAELEATDQSAGQFAGQARAAARARRC